MASGELARTTILLIDGHDTDRTYYADSLRKSLPDYDILEASDGQSGMDIHQARPVDCIVSEIDLEDISTFEVLLRAVPIARRQTVAFVILAQRIVADIGDLARRYGAQEVLIKRLTSGHELAQAVRKAIAKVAPTRKERVVEVYSEQVASPPHNAAYEGQSDKKIFFEGLHESQSGRD
jgi:PleD family two-component response regulator